MNENEKLFLNFVDGLVKYSPDDFDEGMGTVYERIMINNYFRELMKKYNIESVFEGPSDGITGVRGVNSLIFAKNGKRVTYYTPSELEFGKSKEIWKKIGNGLKNVEIKKGEPLKFPFKDNSFDLVWNFCIAEHFSDPVALVKEMKRISKKYVLIMNQNRYNIGTYPHVLYHRFMKQEWDHGDLKWMSFSGLNKMINKNGLKVVEKGVIDVPIWPDTWDTPVRGFFKKGMSSVGKKWDWSFDKSLDEENGMIKFSSIVEKLPIGRFLKLPLAHHLYVLAEK
jgi:SAM-dependent methyltransferase